MKKHTISQVSIFVFTPNLMSDFPLPSQDQNNPTLIPASNNYFFVIKTNSQLPIYGANLADFSTPYHSEQLQFFITSSTNNFETPVILYNIETLHEVANNELKLHYYKDKETIIPEGFNPLQTTLRQRTFWFCSTTFRSGRTAHYNFNIAVYDDTLNLFGYFQFTFNIL